MRPCYDEDGRTSKILFAINIKLVICYKVIALGKQWMDNLPGVKLLLNTCNYISFIVTPMTMFVKMHWQYGE